MESLLNKIFQISPAISYVAIYVRGKLISAQRPDLQNASSSESDRYEELIVNPTLLKLVTQRGNIDCGGAQFVIIRYGSFYEFVMATKTGHISVGMELHADLMKIVDAIRKLEK